MLALTGCATSEEATTTPPQETPPPTTQQQPAPSPVDELNLLTQPTAINLDDETPGPDGFAARIFAARNQPFALVPIESGELELLLFDGIVRRRDMAATEPHQTWSFTPQQLRRYEQRSALGVGYTFSVRWDASRQFEEEDLTIIARYLPPGEGARPVYSAPVTLSRRAR